METISDAMFTVLEYDRQLPLLDLHHIRAEEVEKEIVNFFLALIDEGKTSAQIIYGRGGVGILKQKTIEFLNKNMQEKNPAIKFVKAWKEAVLADAGGRCLVILED